MQVKERPCSKQCHADCIARLEGGNNVRSTTRSARQLVRQPPFIQASLIETQVAEFTAVRSE